MPLVSPYALRHLDLARAPDATCTQRWGHRVIAAIQFIPIVGLLASLIERVVVSALKTLGILLTPLPRTRAEAAGLVAFCQVLPANQLPGVINILSATANLPLLEQAEELDKWLQTDPDVATIESLSLIGKDLKLLPPEIQYFVGLKELCLRVNKKLTSIPKEIGNLDKLERLDLLANGLTSIPVEVGNLRQLKILILDMNALTSVPVELGNLDKLELLELGSNRLTSVPAELGNLKMLKWLYLKQNFLTSVPPEIGNLDKLVHLELPGNALTSVPAELAQLPRNCSMYIKFFGNPLCVIPTCVSQHPGFR